jgi:hypothetical protein
MPTLRVRSWVHRIWAKENMLTVCRIHKTDRKQLEELIKENSERVAMLAWHLYVNEDPPSYNIENDTPDKGQPTFTRFPLCAFFSVSEGYLVQAKTLLDTDEAAYILGKSVSEFLRSLETPASQPTDTACPSNPFSVQPPQLACNR